MTGLSSEIAKKKYSVHYKFHRRYLLIFFWRHKVLHMSWVDRYTSKYFESCIQFLNSIMMIIIISIILPILSTESFITKLELDNTYWNFNGHNRLNNRYTQLIICIYLEVICNFWKSYSNKINRFLDPLIDNRRVSEIKFTCSYDGYRPIYAVAVAGIA